jgi:hypothetical protein
MPGGKAVQSRAVESGQRPITVRGDEAAHGLGVRTAEGPWHVSGQEGLGRLGNRLASERYELSGHRPPGDVTGECVVADGSVRAAAESSTAGRRPYCLDTSDRYVTGNIVFPVTSPGTLKPPPMGRQKGAMVGRNLGLDDVVDHFTLIGDVVDQLRNKAESQVLALAGPVPPRTPRPGRPRCRACGSAGRRPRS